MYLRNKKTGEVGKLHCDMNISPTKYGVFEDTDIRGHYWEYDSLAKLNEEWEDYKPAEPLIRAEKIRKAVKAWAEVNSIKEVQYCERANRSLCILTDMGDEDFSIEFVGWIPTLKDGEVHTIAELCGEEEE